MWRDKVAFAYHFQCWTLWQYVEDLLEPLRSAWRRGPNSADGHNSEVERLGGDYIHLLDGGAGETEAHDFLRANPFLVMNGILGGGVHLERVALFSKVKLGDEYVTDFALVTADSDGARWTFIELESPQAPLFTKGGDPSHELTHGLRQITDWSRFIKHDLAFAKRRLGILHQSARIRGPTEMWRAPTYMVIIGREASLTPDTRTRKAEINENDPRHQIVTYDRLNPVRWGGSRPEGVLDDRRERGQVSGQPWPEDNHAHWNLAVRYLEAIDEARGTGKSAPVD